MEDHDFLSHSTKFMTENNGLISLSYFPSSSTAGYIDKTKDGSKAVNLICFSKQLDWVQQNL